MLWLTAGSPAWADTTVGGTISVDTTWTLSGSPYIVTSHIIVQGTDGADGVTTLTIEPGVQVRFNSNLRIAIGYISGAPGALVAQGTAAEPIVFTSNQTTPSPGDWIGIRLYNTSDDASTVMEHCVVEYGGSSYGAIYLYNAAPRMLNNTIRNNNTTGLYANGSGTSAATVNCNTFTGNDKGIHWIASPAPELHNNNFNGNTNYGLYYTGSATLNAEDNWWGDANGSNTGGDATYGNVDADPWSAQQNDCTGPVANQPPNTPSNPTPADAAVRVSTSGGAALSWIGGDPNPLDVVTYDLYWGTTPGSLQLEASGLSGMAYTKALADQGMTYHWKIIAKDDKGAESAGPFWQFTTDGDPPDLTVNQVITDPAGNLQSGQSVTFTATVLNTGSGPAADAFTVDFLIDGASIGTVAVDQVHLAGQTIQVSQTWTYAGGDPTIDVFADSQTQVTETNENNNHFTASLSAVSDNTAPALASSSPGSGDYLQQIQQITVTLADSQAAVDDAAVMASFSVTDPGQQSIPGTLTEANDTFTFVPANLPLNDGAYQVSLTAADEHGNTQNHVFAFTIDTQPPGKPVITGGMVDSGIIQPRPVVNTTGQFAITLTGTREDGASVWINGMMQTASGNGDWSVQVDLLPGTNALEVWLHDLAGNHSPSEWVDIEMQTGTIVNYEYDDSGRTKRIHGN